jgi:hypothetical protein
MQERILLGTLIDTPQRHLEAYLVQEDGQRWVSLLYPSFNEFVSVELEDLLENHGERIKTRSDTVGVIDYIDLGKERIDWLRRRVELELNAPVALVFAPPLRHSTLAG